MPNVDNLRIFEDASGAPAVVSSGRYRYAADTIGGEIRLHLLSGSGSRRESRISARRAEKAYRAARDAALPEGWIARNVEMYG